MDDSTPDRIRKLRRSAVPEYIPQEENEPILPGLDDPFGQPRPDHPIWKMEKDLQRSFNNPWDLPPQQRYHPPRRRPPPQWQEQPEEEGEDPFGPPDLFAGHMVPPPRRG